MAGAGAGPMGSVYDDGVRRSARLASLRARATEEVKKEAGGEGGSPLEDVDVMTEVLDAADAVGVMAGGSKRRGGEVKTLAAIRDAVRGVFDGGAAVVSAVDTVLATTIKSAPAIAGIAATGTVLNHPTLLGNLSQLCAQVFAKGLDVSVTSTWGDWGAALVQIAKSGAVVAAAVGKQTLQGPVVPVAVASALLMWLATKQGKSVSALIKEDLGGALTAQIDAAKAAYVTEGQKVAAAQLKELAKRAQVPTAGEGAAEMSALAKAAPIMAAQAPIVAFGVPAEGVVGVRGTLSPAPAAALGRRPKRGREPDAAMALDEGTGAGDTVEPGTKAKKEGGRRRKTKKAKKTKRRVTRRKV